MDDATRRALHATVDAVRRQLETSVREGLESRFGIRPDGSVEPPARLALDSGELQARDELVAYLRHLQAIAHGAKAAAAKACTQLVREIAFTHLNRLVALKMAEHPSRRLVREAIGHGVQSNGFRFYRADHPEAEALWESGQQEAAYRGFLLWQGQALAGQVADLFAPESPANRFVPPLPVLDDILAQINAPEVAPAWAEEETVGWIYQYFTPKEQRDAARQANPAPQDSYELAFLNQFYTPRYVVEFLTQNTLGRLWYGMRGGQTTLVDRCRYLLPPEALGLNAPAGEGSGSERAGLGARDPRDLRICDPACGSGHFLLYAFELLEAIYHEAWEDPTGAAFTRTERSLRQDYPEPDAFAREVPGLILRYNLHGVDIDPRAVQVAGLALWLRAQRALEERGVPRSERPDVPRAQVFCAEPMPEDGEPLDAFLAELDEPALAPAVRRLVARMRLVDEVGSLLKAEEEIELALTTAGRHLLRDLPLGRMQSGEDPLWADADERLLAALGRFEERAGHGRAYVRRLFARETRQGLAALDLLRAGRFDVVLMNPPFGHATPGSRPYLDEQYPVSRHDLAAAFVERGLNLLRPGGMLGVLATRTPLFLSSSARWRQDVVLGRGRLTVMADLGQGVLESAKVAPAAYCLEARREPDEGSSGVDAIETALFMRLLEAEDKATTLADMVECQRRRGTDIPGVFLVDPASFRQIPGAPFAYGVHESLRRKFRELPRFESEGREVRVGLQTSDDFRFVRAWWEVDPRRILHVPVKAEELDDPARLREYQDACREQTWHGKRWVPFAKGGAYSPYYADVYLVVDWENDGERVRNFYGSNGRLASRPQNTDYYFRPGLTWSRRPHKRGGFGLVSPGTIFSDTGCMVFAPSAAHLWHLTALLNSDAYVGMLHLLMPRGGPEDDEQTLKYEVGYVKSVPLPTVNARGIAKLAGVSRALYVHYQQQAAFHEARRDFVTLEAGMVIGADIQEILTLSRLASTKASKGRASLDGAVAEIATEQYSMTADEAQDIADTLASSAFQPPSPDGDAPEDREEPTDDTAMLRRLVSYAVGCAFGRWDIRNSYKSAAASLREVALDTPPACPPGMLKGPDGYPASDASALDTQAYPLPIRWPGILVDDPSHPDDIVTCVQEVFDHLCGGAADSFLSTVCAALHVSSLRDYFRSHRRFFADHCLEYSKNTQQASRAPIYWLLQSPKRHYAIWLYYHRLDGDLLFKVLQFYVEPKIRREEQRLADLHAQSGGCDGARARRQAERAVEQQEALLVDIREFRERLARVADLHLVPNLDDGVVLNAAPFHELMPWPEAARYWRDLLQGKYDWSDIAGQIRERQGKGVTLA